MFIYLKHATNMQNLLFQFLSDRLSLSVAPGNSSIGSGREVVDAVLAGSGETLADHGLSFAKS